LAVEVGQQYDEFVSAVTAGGIGGTDTIHQTHGDLLQYAVAACMSQCVVESLESIEVEE
jgi:hypothetical protein